MSKIIKLDEAKKSEEDFSDRLAGQIRKETGYSEKQREIIIPYLSPWDGKIHRYFPDFIVKVRENNGNHRTKVIEVKPYKQTIPPEKGKKRKKTYLSECTTYIVNEAKWEAAKEFCKKRNWSFVILTEKELF